MGASTQESLETWNDVIQDRATNWADAMEDDIRKDLPPDTAKLIVKASRAFADLGENILEHLGIPLHYDEKEEDEEDD